MKKKGIANLIMVAVITLIMAAGIVAAVLMGGKTDPVTPGGTSAELLNTGTGSYNCTVAIRCDTILSNLSRLEEGKAAYVPENGYILAETVVSFTEGETVFDVLSRVCKDADIQLEYSWNPLFNSYYVEGIHHLYEFDCGPESGWVYTVNGGHPNYGSSDYQVQPDDQIVWCYSCAGLGTDVR